MTSIANQSYMWIIVFYQRFEHSLAWRSAMPCRCKANMETQKQILKTCVEFKYVTKNITYEIYMYFYDDTNMTKNIRHHTQSDIKLNSNFSKQYTNTQRKQQTKLTKPLIIRQIRRQTEGKKQCKLKVTPTETTRVCDLATQTITTN